MDVVENTKHLMMGAGSSWVLWLLLALSGASVAVIVERAITIYGRRVDVEALRIELRRALFRGGLGRGREALARFTHPAARVVLRGMDAPEGEPTAEQAQEAMAAEVIAQRKRLERRLGFLGTLGANAPFIGLFGTVIGILQAFDALGRAGAAQAQGAALAPQAVMASIAEALVATAVGIGVAIPAVFAFNAFQREIKAALADADMLSRELLAYLHAGRREAEPRPSPIPARITLTPPLDEPAPRLHKA